MNLDYLLPRIRFSTRALKRFEPPRRFGGTSMSMNRRRSQRQILCGTAVCIPIIRHDRKDHRVHKGTNPNPPTQPHTDSKRLRAKLAGGKELAGPKTMLIDLACNSDSIFMRRIYGTLHGPSKPSNKSMKRQPKELFGVLGTRTIPIWYHNISKNMHQGHTPMSETTTADETYKSPNRLVNPLRTASCF